MCANLYHLSLAYFCFVFFFKQKTAYEMRISDWSSDVCSSDLSSSLQGRLPVAGQRISPFGAYPSARSRQTGVILESIDECNPLCHDLNPKNPRVIPEIGRASCRERVCQYV